MDEGELDVGTGSGGVGEQAGIEVDIVVAGQECLHRCQRRSIETFVQMIGFGPGRRWETGKGIEQM